MRREFTRQIAARAGAPGADIPAQNIVALIGV
jgi:hypothetical protein